MADKRTFPETETVDLIEDLTWVRQRVRNCRGAIESNQVTDKDVRGSLLRITERLDNIIESYRGHAQRTGYNLATGERDNQETDEAYFHTAQCSPELKPLPGELAMIQIALETLRHIANYSPVSRIQPVMIARDALKKIDALTFESEPVKSLVTVSHSSTGREGK